MTIKLLDYARSVVEVDVGDIDTIGAMSIQVVTGDEILKVIYKDYTTREFDSSRDRCANFYDGEYELYNATTGLNRLDDKAFLNRYSSYAYLYGGEDDEEEP